MMGTFNISLFICSIFFGLFGMFGYLMPTLIKDLSPILSLLFFIHASINQLIAVCLAILLIISDKYVNEVKKHEPKKRID